jgi:hypothetical protein
MQNFATSQRAYSVKSRSQSVPQCGDRARGEISAAERRYTSPPHGATTASAPQ